MKIVQILHSYPPQSIGGTELYTQSLSEELSKTHQVLIIYSGDHTSQNEQLRYDQNTFSNIVVRSVSRFKPTSFTETYLNPRADIEILQHIKDFSPDVIHVEHLLSHSISLIDELSSIAIPLIFTLHDYWYICPQCFLTHLDGSLCDGAGNGKVCLSCENADGSRYITLANAITLDNRIIRLLGILKKYTPEFLRSSVRYFYQRIIRRKLLPFNGFIESTDRLDKMVSRLNMADIVISPSKLLSERYQRAGVKNVIVLPHGIRAITGPDLDLNKYIDIERKKLIFAYFGSIIKHKGLHILIDAFNSIASVHSSLLIYGKRGQDPDYEARLVNSISHKGIKFMGHIEHKKIYETLNTVHVIVIPSTCAENYPLIANEAFVAKTPVIASNVGGLNELIEHGISGFLFEQGNAAELKKLINQIVENPKVLQMLSKNIPSVKNMEVHAQELVKLYNQVVKSRMNQHF